MEMLTFKCEICPKEYDKLESLKRHIRYHKAEKFKCDICRKEFVKKISLTNHLKSHRGEFTCDICGKSLSSSERLEEHIRLHSDVSLYKCEECGREYTNKYHLNRHQKTHKLTERYCCVFCPKIFNTKFSLERHQVIHEIKCEMPYECSHCDMAFQRKDVLIQHMKLHSDLKEFICNGCEKAFSQSSNFNHHVKVMSVKSSYVCRECSQDFSMQCALRNHINKDHIIYSDGKFFCSFCNSSFSLISSLNRHKLQHYKEYRCNECQKFFKTKPDLDGHKCLGETKNVMCVYCDKLYCSAESARRHMKTDHLKTKCPDCGKWFAFESELNEHQCTKSDVIPNDFITTLANWENILV